MADKRLSQFKKYILFQEDFLFITSLYFIFNEENLVKTINDELKFIMTYSKFKKYLIKLRKDAKDSCGVVCYKTENCQGHKTLNLMEKYQDFMVDSVQRRGLFYKHVKFIKIKDDTEPMCGFMLIPIDEVDIGWRSWSQRLSFLT